MRRMIIAFVIILLLMAGWAWEKYLVTNICSDMTERIDLITQASKNSDGERLIRLTKEFEKDWVKKEKILDTITPHDDTDEINLNLVRLKYYAEKYNFILTEEITYEMKEHFKEIQEKRKVTYINIL